MPVLSLLLWIKVASFSLLKIKNASLSVFLQIKVASFIFIVTDQNCRPFIVEDKKMPVLSVLLQIKMPVFSSLLWIKVDSFSSLKIKNASFICFVADKKKCQFYLHCCGSKLPVLFPLSQIKIASFILIFKDQNCKFYLKCHRQN